MSRSKKKKKNRIRFISVCYVTIFIYTAAIVCFMGTGGICLAYEYESYGRRDPFVPLIGVTTGSFAGGIEGILTVEDVQLQGILLADDGTRRVIINGEILEQGDRVQRLYIESISSNEVKIKIDDESFTVKLYE